LNETLEFPFWGLLRNQKAKREIEESALNNILPNILLYTKLPHPIHETGVPWASLRYS